MAEDLEKEAREWIAANRPEPLKCIRCGTVQTSVPECSVSYCQKSQFGHVYEMLISTDYEDIEAKRLAAFARLQINKEREECAKAVCGQCAAGIPLTQFEVGTAHVTTLPCAAIAIRGRK